MISSITKNVFLFAVVLQVVLSLQSCSSNSGCGGPSGRKYSINYFLQIDTANKDSIKQISYKNGGKTFYPNSRTAQFYFTPSKSTTEIYITTFNQIDTLIFDNSRVFSYNESPCGDDQLEMTLKDEKIIKHTFASYNFTSNDPYSTQNNNSYVISKILHVRLK